MAAIGYKRVSSEGQNLDRQDLGELDKVFEEKLSGKSAKDRPALQAMIEYAREGDSVVVYSIDRLARDLRDLRLSNLLSGNFSESGSCLLAFPLDVGLRV